MRAAAALLLAALAGGPAWGADYGILLMAHGGNPEWNGTVARIAAGLEQQAPTETALGMADSDALQRAVDRLERRGVSRIVAVPLFIHSRSEVMDQTRYVLGLSSQPSRVFTETMAAMMARMHAAGAMPAAMHHMMASGGAPIRAGAPITLAPALDDSTIVAGLLWRRALALSREPARETVILVAHGPVDPAANEAWLQSMSGQAERVRRAGGFKRAVAFTIRDDAPAAVKGPALARLREAVRRASEEGGRAIVIPYLIARGGIEDHITAALSGLDYAWDGRTLCPDPAIDRWAQDRAAASARISAAQENL